MLSDTFLEQLVQKVKQTLEEKRYKQDLSQEVETTQGQRVYSDFFKTLMDEFLPDQARFAQTFSHSLEDFLLFCPHPHEKEAFGQDLVWMAFHEFIRHSMELVPQDRVSFIHSQIEQSTLLWLKEHWLALPETRESFLRGVSQQVKQFRLRRSQTPPSIDRFHEHEVQQQWFEPYFTYFHTLFETEFRKCVQKWPEELDQDDAILRLSWESYQAFLKYCPNTQKSYEGYLKQIIKTRSINLVQSYAPMDFAVTRFSLRQLESILSIEIPQFLKKQEQAQIPHNQWIPPELKSVVKDLPSVPPKGASFHQKNAFREAFAHSLTAAIVNQLKQLKESDHVFTRKTDFLKAFEERVGSTLCAQLGKLVAMHCQHYRRVATQSFEDDSEEQEYYEQALYAQMDNTWLQAESRDAMFMNPEQNVSQKGLDVYKSTFLTLLQKRPFEEQFLLKRKAEYKPSKRPKTPKFHDLEHSQRRSFDEVIELVRLAPQKYKMFYEYFRTRSHIQIRSSENETNTMELPNLIHNQEFFPKYVYQEKLEQLAVTPPDQKRILQKTRVPATYKLSLQTIESLSEKGIPHPERLQTSTNKQFESQTELFQYFKSLFGKATLDKFKELVAQKSLLPKKEPLGLRRGQVRLWLEQILCELRRLFLTTHPETDVQIKDLLVILEDQNELLFVEPTNDTEERHG